MDTSHLVYTRVHVSVSACVNGCVAVWVCDSARHHTHTLLLCATHTLLLSLAVCDSARHDTHIYTHSLRLALFEASAAYSNESCHV